jgi:hypothetical protein
MAPCPVCLNKIAHKAGRSTAAPGREPPGCRQLAASAPTPSTEGIAPRPETTFGNVKADVLERFVPGIKRGNFVYTILNSDWPD